MPNQKINYQKELDKIIDKLIKTNTVPKLMLHSCCAPCSSYVLEYLSEYFDISVLYYNPNITPKEEYEYRKAEQIRLISEKVWKHSVNLADCSWNPDEFTQIAKGMEAVPEGGERCFKCYELRLRAAAKAAKNMGYDYFGSTLSISPLKNAEKLNEIGYKLGAKYDISYLPSDFKKKNGYKRSIELSKEHNLYRQDYCGCIYSKLEREHQKENI